MDYHPEHEASGEFLFQQTEKEPIVVGNPDRQPLAFAANPPKTRSQTEETKNDAL